MVRLDIEHADVNKQIRDAVDNGDHLTQLDLELKRAGIESEQADVLKFTDFATSTGGKLLRSAQFLTTERFDFITLKKDIEAQQGHPLTPEQETKFRKLAEEHEKLKSQFSDLQEQAAKEEEQHKAEMEEARKKWEEGIREKIYKEKVRTKSSSLSEEKLARKEELAKEFRGRFNDITTILTTLADSKFREYASLIIEETAGDFAKFSKELIDNVGEKIKEHLPKLFEELGGKTSEGEKKIASLEKQIEDVKQGKQRGQNDTPFYTKEQEQEIIRLKSELEQAKRDMGLEKSKKLPQATLTEEEKAFRRRSARQEYLENLLERGKTDPSVYMPKQKKPSLTQAHIKDINIKIKKLEDEVWQEKEKIRRQNMGRVETTIRNLTKFQRAMIFSNPWGMLRLTYAAMFRPLIRTVPELAKLALSNLPITKRILEKSPSQYRPDIASVKTAMGKYYSTLLAKQTFKDAWSEYSKRSNFSLEHESRVPEDIINKVDAVLAKPQQTHGFLKAFPKISALESGYTVALDNLSKTIDPETGRYYDITNPEVRQVAMADAKREAYADVFMDSSELSKMTNEVLSKGSASQNGLIQAVSLALSQQMPILKVPANFYQEILQQLPIGGLLDAAQIVGRSGERGTGSYRGINNLTPDQAHKASRALVNQAVGLMVVAAGVALYKKYGDDAVKKIEDYHYWLHNTALPLLVMGMDSQIAKSDGEKEGLLKAEGKTLIEETRKLPQIVAAQETAKISWAAARAASGKENWDKASQKAKEMLATLLIPAGSAELAKRMDDNKKRDPHTFKEIMEMRIPGLRDLVPSNVDKEIDKRLHPVHKTPQQKQETKIRSEEKERQLQEDAAKEGKALPSKKHHKPRSPFGNSGF